MGYGGASFSYETINMTNVTIQGNTSFSRGGGVAFTRTNGILNSLYIKDNLSSNTNAT